MYIYIAYIFKKVTFKAVDTFQCLSNIICLEKLKLLSTLSFLRLSHFQRSVAPLFPSSVIDQYFSICFVICSIGPSNIGTPWFSILGLTFILSHKYSLDKNIYSHSLKYHLYALEGQLYSANPVFFSDLKCLTGWTFFFLSNLLLPHSYISQ